MPTKQIENFKLFAQDKNRELKEIVKLDKATIGESFEIDNSNDKLENCYLNNEITVSLEPTIEFIRFLEEIQRMVEDEQTHKSFR